MKKIGNIVSWCLGQAFLAFICYILYIAFLANTFNLYLGYMQWLSIVIIIQCIMPKDKNTNNDNSKIGNFITDIKKQSRNKYIDKNIY